MELKVIRFSSQNDSSSGLLFDATNEMKFLCYTLEDERREEKVKKRKNPRSRSFFSFLSFFLFFWEAKNMH